MRSRILVGLAGLGMLAGCQATEAPSSEAPGVDRLNPMIALHEQDLPVFGISHPSINAGRGGGDAAEPPPQPDLGMVAQETAGYRLGDYMYTGDVSERFLGYVTALEAAGASMSTHPFIAKIPRYGDDAEDRAEAVEAIHEQLDAGHVGVMIQYVSSREEIEAVVSAMRFVSDGGTRPETDIGFAASYWGLTEDEYLEKSDVWPLDPAGELIVWAIVESDEGLANLDEIASTPGLGVLWAGAGSLRGVFTEEDAAGERVVDQAGYDAAIASILAACLEHDVPCGYPANNPEDIEALMNDGWSVFVMQRFNDDGQGAVVRGRELSGRPTTAMP